MKPSRLGKTLPILLLALWIPRPSLAIPNSQEAPAEVDASGVSGPGDPQNHLAATVGEWDMTIRAWTNSNSEPAETRGSATARWILDDHFVETRLEGEMLDTTFEGLRIEGYDVAAGQFVSTWRDSRGTYTLVFRGKCDATCAIRTMTADFTDPVSKTELTIKSVTTIISDDSYRYESYIVTPSGTEIKNMEFDATRKR
jgi:hypothetical protein